MTDEMDFTVILFYCYEIMERAVRESKAESLAENEWLRNEVENLQAYKGKAHRELSRIRDEQKNIRKNLNKHGIITKSLL